MGMKFTEDQQRVIDLRNCNILVSAAAGSGKTAVLVERIVELVSGSGCDSARAVDIDRLLIVTFTNAAAAQMRERITKALSDRVEAEPDNEHIKKQLMLIHNAKIMTIHSFCLYLIKKSFQRYRSRPGLPDGGRRRNAPVEAGGFVRASGRAVRAGTAGIYRLRGIFCLRRPGKAAGRADRTAIYLFRKLSFPGKMAAAAPHGLSCGDV